ncbi:MAG: hypothetical protein ACRBCI_15105 [Cellvibrionaceae bacterium]
MKKIGLILFALCFPGVVFAQFPITKIVDVNKLEVWPSNNGTGRYSAYISPGVPEAGCTNIIFSQLRVGLAQKQLIQRCWLQPWPIKK